MSSPSLAFLAFSSPIIQIPRSLPPLRTMSTRSVKGLLNLRLSAAIIKLNAKTNLIPHLKNKFFADFAPRTPNQRREPTGRRVAQRSFLSLTDRCSRSLAAVWLKGETHLPNLCHDAHLS